MSVLDPRPDEERSGHSLLIDIWSRLAVVETQNNHIMAAQGRAEDSRREMHGKLDSFNRVADTVERLEPIVMHLDQLRLRAAGARSVGDWLARAMWAVIGSSIAAAVELMHYFTGKH
jgi:hypothetical protein